MKIKILLIAAFLLFAGCDNNEDQNLKESRKHVIIQDEFLLYTTCIDGVTYYIRGRGITIALNTESKIITCTERAK